MRIREPFKNLAEAVPTIRLSEGGVCLLVVDCHHYSLSPNHGYGRVARERGIFRELDEYYEQLEQVTPNLQHLVDSSRARAVSVIFTRLVGSCDVPSSVSPQARATGLWAERSSIDAAFVPELGPQNGELVLDKTTVSAFADTGLGRTLSTLKARSLVISGVLAEGAVALSARDAADLGYNVVVVSDACAGATWTSQSLAMTALVGGLVRIRSTAAVVEMLNGTRT